ncbi:hypothetical protein AKN93_10135 [Thiopseudomonas alkaliphila]|uniref:Probable membrane transporter protein n=1 Tax=Thiopseudomonas alkaliphila TaxID=1697053 RepID=A0A0K1XCJ0_9GAMM|nr:sulfite exporter TauE/SafE family protein [Thiopseudomonas alkaliphila]AKX46602.1 hypothetical protein AKN94_03965 [Thiopseudomonas alkaliphila]AKX49707.1 hypothetical protein AKN93_10135 [Thiopseudomonas alkaliphila]AKX50431.1 hypothetical protein AKN92_02200 [Thiopseudomonas alkaliphila]AKX52405.1 hypothetical protein AKN91_00975 [Thiopseudomonas alkaliphila]AKX54726.1 hypothetical protein AKN90_02645 [Thiopseudomonas alkaliphila]
MTAIDWLINTGLGVALGVLGGLFGIGGGLIAIPVLGILYGFDQQLAQGTALVMVVPNVLLGVYRYHQKNKFNLKTASLLGGFSFVLSWVGASIAVGLEAQVMRYFFVGFLLVLMLWNLTQVIFVPRAEQPARAWGWFAGLGGFAGFMGGLFGVGGAVVATPILTLWFGLSQVVAQGLSLALALPSTLVTLSAYAWHQQVHWPIGLSLCVGGLLGVSYGVKIAHQLPARLMKALFSGFLLLSAILLFYQT